jgi:hypothetical protein
MQARWKIKPTSKPNCHDEGRGRQGGAESPILPAEFGMKTGGGNVAIGAEGPQSVDASRKRLGAQQGVNLGTILDGCPVAGSGRFPLAWGPN